MKVEMPKPIVFTDIDGTILDEENSNHSTKRFIEQILCCDAIIVLCSSKTKEEIETIRRELNVTDPFISENGGAIFIPKNYFPFAIPYSRHTAKYDVIELGTPYPEVRKKLARVSSAIGSEIVGFGDMTAGDIEKYTGLPLAMAVSAKNREYDEPFHIIGGNKNAVTVQAFEAEGLTVTAGSKFLHAVANTDKGKAVTLLKNLFERVFRDTVTYGIGDGENDLSMLAVVDVPQLVRRRMGGHYANVVAWRNLLRLILMR